jgi:glycosyltransferase involved in cell wall biosynthesis
VGGTAEMMADPSLLVKEGDTNALTEVLLELLTLDEAALRLLGKAARDWIVQNRSLRAGARSTLGHYRSAVASDAHDAS